MALTTFYTPRWRAVGPTGAPYAGGKLKFYEAGTSTPLPVYSDVDGTISLGTTVTADAGGLFAEMFMLPQAYKVELYTSADVLVWTADDWFPPAASSAGNVDISLTAGVTFAAGEAGYISDGSGGLNAGQIYKTDADLAYASNSPQIYFATAAIAAGAAGLFRSAGTVTGLAGLTPGALYFLSGTAGAISTTAGTFRRFVGQAISTTELAIQTNPPINETIDLRLKDIVDGRLTLTSGTPVTTSNVTAATTVYWALYRGNQIGLYTGTRWVVMTLAELSIAVPSTTNQMYDVFVDYNDGTPVLAVTAWTNDTTRATALTTQDGVYVKTGDTQQRYVGSFRTTGVSGQTEDSLTKRFLFNYYNPVETPVRVTDSTDTWTYSTAAYQQANASTANQIAVVTGVVERSVSLKVIGRARNSGTGATPFVAIGLDSTTTPATGMLMGTGTASAANVSSIAQGWLDALPSLGYHYYAWLEYDGSGGGTTTWNGDNGAPTLVQTGITGTVWR